MRQQFMKMAQTFLWRMERFLERSSKLGNPAWFRSEDFPWIAELEKRAPEIGAELEQFLENPERIPSMAEISPEQKAITKDDRWKSLFFLMFGRRAEVNLKRFPATAAALEEIPGLKTSLFSILEPGKHVKAHRGIFKGVIRAHLPLKIPEPREQCGLKVDGETRHWETGKVLVFDDTYRHEAWNYTTGIRAVLMIDVVRPLRFPANLLNGFLLRCIQVSPLTRSIHTNTLKWEKKLEDALKPVA